MNVEKDGRLINTMEPPPLPTPQQSERIKKYGEDIVRKKEEQDRKAAQNEFLRHSIRNSQKMRALKHHAVQLGKYINTVRMPRALCNFLKRIDLKLCIRKMQVKMNSIDILLETRKKCEISNIMNSLK